MSASQSGVFNIQEFQDMGAPLVGGRLYTYAHGTTTQKTAYTDRAGEVPHAYTLDGAGGQYIALNARGELPASIYFTNGSYDVALKSSSGATIWTRRVDPISVNADVDAALAEIDFVIQTAYSAINNRGDWAATTGYNIKDVVNNSGTWYLCIVPHTSSPLFATDEPTKWRIYQGLTAIDMALPYGSSGVGFIQEGIPAVPRTVQDELRETVKVTQFGASPSASASTNDAAFATAWNKVKAIGGKLVIPPGTYQIIQFALSQSGGNTNANFEIEANGATLVGTTSAATFSVYRVQGLVINGLKVQKHASATYASILDSFWFANFTDCDFGVTKLHADNNWGVYWNEFNGCEHASLHFDLSSYTINQNVWKGGRVGAITKTDAGHATFKEAYNNVFIGVDVLGAIDWRDTQAAFIDPIIFRDCNFEYSGNNYGYINSTGGRINAVNTSTTTMYPWDNMRSKFEKQPSGSNYCVGWNPESSVNLIAGGACQTYSQHIIEVGVSGYMTIAADSTSPTGNGYCYKLAFAGSNASPKFRLRMPVEYLEEAKKVGYVSFSWWQKAVVGGGAFTSNNAGTYPTGDSYLTGFGTKLASPNWEQLFVNIPVGPGSTDVSIYIGSNSVTTCDFRVANVCCTIGNIAHPYSPASTDVSAKRALSFDKSIIANSTPQNTFSIDVPASGYFGRIAIKAYNSDANSVAIYSGIISYARQSTFTVANVVQVSKVQSGGYSGSSAGCIDAITVSAATGTVTVLSTVATYSGNPAKGVRYSLEFLDRDEVITLL